MSAVGSKLLCVAFERHLSIAQHVATVRDASRPMDMLDSQEDADVVTGRYLRQAIEQTGHDDGREAERHLVKQQELRPGGQGSGQPQDSLLTAGEQSGTTPQMIPELGKQIQA